MDITLKKISEITSINISTIRFYKDKYLQYLTTSGEGRTMKYEQVTSVAIFSLVAESYKKNFDQDQIIELLDQRFGVNIVTDLVAQPDDNNAAATQQDVLSEIRSMFKEEMQSRDEAIAELSDKVDSLANGSKSRDELIMTNINLIRERQSKRGFWSRVFFK